MSFFRALLKPSRRSLFFCQQKKPSCESRLRLPYGIGLWHNRWFNSNGNGNNSVSVGNNNHSKPVGYLPEMENDNTIKELARNKERERLEMVLGEKYNIKNELEKIELSHFMDNLAPQAPESQRGFTTSKAVRTNYGIKIARFNPLQQMHTFKWLNTNSVFMCSNRMYNGIQNGINNGSAVLPDEKKWNDIPESYKPALIEAVKQKNEALFMNVLSAIPEVKDWDIGSKSLAYSGGCRLEHQTLQESQDISGNEAYDMIINKIEGILWNETKVSEEELKCVLDKLYRKGSNDYFPRSRIEGKETLSVDMRLCDWDNNVFPKYDIIEAYCRSDVPSVISVVGVSGCGKSSTLLRTNNFYTMLFEIGLKEFNDKSTTRLGSDIAKIYSDFSLADEDVYVKNDKLYSQAVERCKIDIVGKLFYLRKLFLNYPQLTPTQFRDGQLNGGQRDIERSIEILKSLPSDIIEQLHTRLIAELPVVTVAIDEFQIGIDFLGSKIVSKRKLSSAIDAAGSKTSSNSYSRGFASVLLNAASERHSVICCGTSNDILKINEFIGSTTGRDPLHLVDWKILEYKDLINILTKLFNLNEETIRYAFDETKWKLFRPRFVEMVIQRLIPTFRPNKYLDTQRIKDIEKVYKSEPNSLSQREGLKMLVEYIEENDIISILNDTTLNTIDEDTLRTLYGNTLQIHSFGDGNDMYEQITVKDVGKSIMNKFLCANISVVRCKSNGYGGNIFALAEPIFLKPIINYLDEKNKSNIIDRPIILTLDGGGVKGIVSCVMLDMLEEYLKTLDKNISLNDIVDSYYGCSIGGIIALKLASGSTPKECTKFFTGDIPKRLFNEIDYTRLLGFIALKYGSNPNGILSSYVYNDVKDELTKIERIFEEIVEESFGSDHSMLLNNYSTNKNIAVLTTETTIDFEKQYNFIKPSRNVLLSNYKQLNTNPFRSNDESFTVKDAALATSRIPYVLGESFSKNNRWYIDGGLGDVNPACYAVSECISELHTLPSGVFSLGCGVSPLKSNISISDEEIIMNALRKTLISPTGTHKILNSMYCNDDTITYQRINPYITVFPQVNTFTSDSNVIKSTETYIRQSSDIQLQIKKMAHQMYKIYKAKYN